MCVLSTITSCPVRVEANGELIGHRAGSGTKSAAFFPKQRGRHVLQADSRWELRVNIVSHFRAAIAFAGRQWVRDRIAAQVDHQASVRMPHDRGRAHSSKFSPWWESRSRQDALRMAWLRDVLPSVTDAEPDEAVPVGWAFLYFFCLLCGY